MGFPEEFSIYMNYVRKLAFEETPDYDYLRGLMDSVLKNLNCEDDGLYDWVYVIDKRRKEKEKEKERRNDLIYPQNATSKPNLYNGKIQQLQQSLQYHSNYNSQDFRRSTPNELYNIPSKPKVNEKLSYHSSKQPSPIQMQLQNNPLKNSSNIYNSRNSRKYQNYRQLDKLTRSNSNYDKYYKNDDGNYPDKPDYSKLMISDIDIRGDQKINKYDNKSYKNKLKNKNTKETENNTPCFKHLFLCCFK